MKRLVALMGLALAVAAPAARAQQGADDQFLAIYTQIQQADALQAGGHPREALADYTQALTGLQQLHRMFPKWEPDIVNYRLNYLAQKVKDLRARFPGAQSAPLSAPPPTHAPAQVSPPPTNAVSAASAGEMEIVLSTLRSRMQGLQAENETLEAKLKEALRAQPATVNTQQLAAAQAQVLSLMKENDLLRVSLAGATNRAASGELSKLRQALAAANQKLADATNRADKLARENQSLQSAANVNQLEKAALEQRLKQRPAPAASSATEAADNEIKTLRARLAVDEAQAVPYTPEELALMKSPTPALTTNADGEQASVTELPGGSAALAAEAQNAFSAGDFSKADADYRRILQRDPTNALALANLATIELQENKLAEAEKHITAALAQNPDDAYALATYGNLKFRQHQYDQALNALSRAAKLDPQNPQILNYLGVTLSEKGLRTQAETALRKAVELDPDYAAAQNNLAVVYLSDSPPMPALARYHYQKALDLGQPRNPDLEKKLAALGAPVNQ